MAFREIIGQSRAIELIKSYYREKRPHHSYLFLGPRGVGKTTCALNFAKLLNCENPLPDAEPCDTCRSCEAIDGGYHPDVQLVTLPNEKRELGIEEIRQVRQSAYTSAAWGSWKVYIVEKAEVLTREASDALLKILEEPPERCLFILLAPNIADVSPTIASRCHIINFLPAKKEEIASFLEKRHHIDRELAFTFASLAEGRPGFAITLASDEKMRTVREEIFSFLLELEIDMDYSLRAGQEFVKIANQLREGEERDKIQQCLLFSSSFFRDLLLLRLSGDESLLINYDKRNKLKEVVNKYSLDFLNAALNALQRTYRLLQPGSNVNHRLALEVMFMDILGGR
ncbi:DNA polymerase III subunit delta' [bacterium]|nr:DNA polymerase III subunit delta' [bacterium]